MRLRVLAVSCVLVLGGSLRGLAQQPTGPATLEGLLDSGESQESAATVEAGEAEAGQKRPAGTVTRPKDGVQHPDLDKAWAAYDTAVEKATESIKAAIVKRFDAAAAKGDLDEAEKWQTALRKFEKAGEAPTEPEAKAAVGAAVADLKKAREELSTAYEAVVKSLTMEKRISEAKAARAEKSFVTRQEVGSPTETSRNNANVGTNTRKPRVPLTAIAFAGHHYLLVIERKGWNEAARACEEMGGHLVTISSSAENELVARLAAASGKSPWIGLSDHAEEGKWQWVTGEPVTFTAWAAGQPDNWANAEDYAVGGETWNDAGAKIHPIDAFVCEWDY